MDLDRAFDGTRARRRRAASCKWTTARCTGAPWQRKHQNGRRRVALGRGGRRGDVRPHLDVGDIGVTDMSWLFFAPALTGHRRVGHPGVTTMQHCASAFDQDIGAWALERQGDASMFRTPRPSTRHRWLGGPQPRAWRMFNAPRPSTRTSAGASSNGVNLDGAFSGSGCCSTSCGVAQQDETGDCQIIEHAIDKWTILRWRRSAMRPRNSSCQRDSPRLASRSRESPSRRSRMRSRNNAPWVPRSSTKAGHERTPTTCAKFMHHRDQDLFVGQDSCRDAAPRRSAASSARQRRGRAS